MPATLKDFPWGNIEKVYSVGKYQIAEYQDFEGLKLFHGWVDGEDAREGWTTLERAMIGLIALDNLEVNHARHSADCIHRILEI